MRIAFAFSGTGTDLIGDIRIPSLPACKWWRRLFKLLPHLPEIPLSPLMQSSFPRFPSLISFGAAVVTHSDGTSTRTVEHWRCTSRRPMCPCRSMHTYSRLPADILLVDGRFGIGSDQDQRERESVMVTLWGTPPPGTIMRCHRTATALDARVRD